MTDTTIVDPDALMAEILLTPEGRADPYSRYAAIREHSAAYRSSIGFVVVGRFEDCQLVLRDPRFGKGSGVVVWEQYGLTEEEWIERFGNFTERANSMLGQDPPNHTRLRRLVAKAFTPKTVEQLRPDIVRLTDQLLDGFERGAVVDVMPELALKLPIAVISEMLGVPESYWAELQPLVRTATVSLEINVTLGQLEAANEATRQIADRFEGLIAERREHPTDDLLSQLIHVEEEGDQLSHAELISTVILLFGAGFETTTNLIGNGLLALLDHPDQLQRLRDDRTLLGSAVEELLRWDSPVQIDGRAAFEDLDMHGIPVQAGEQVVTLLGSANRDPRVFDDPDRFDVGRGAAHLMSFGAGIHFCLGAALARAEGQVLFDRLLDRFALIEPAWGDERPRYRESIVLRGLESLPVRFA
ncbi:MAG: cytochrome P450 [Acidimicrobiia bacterium]